MLNPLSLAIIIIAVMNISSVIYFNKASVSFSVAIFGWLVVILSQVNILMLRNKHGNKDHN